MPILKQLTKCYRRYYNSNVDVFLYFTVCDIKKLLPLSDVGFMAM